MGHFDFFQLIKNYAETTLLIDMKLGLGWVIYYI